MEHSMTLLIVAGVLVVLSLTFSGITKLIVRKRIKEASKKPIDLISLSRNIPNKPMADGKPKMIEFIDKGLFSIGPLPISFYNVSERLNTLENKEEYYKKLENKYKILVNFDKLQEILSSPDFETLGYEMIYNYLNECNIPAEDEYVTQMSKLSQEKLQSINNSEVLDLAFMLYFGIGCKENREESWNYFYAASKLGNKIIYDIVNEFYIDAKGFVESYYQDDCDFDEKEESDSPKTTLPLNTLWKYFTLSKEGYKDGAKTYYELITKYFTEYDSVPPYECYKCCNYALNCAQRLAESESVYWLRLGDLFGVGDGSDDDILIAEYYYNKAVENCKGEDLEDAKYKLKQIRTWIEEEK